MLRKLLEGRLVFTPTADGTAVEFRGTGVLDPVLRGIVDGDGLPKASGSRWRFEPVSNTGRCQLDTPASDTSHGPTPVSVAQPRGWRPASFPAAIGRQVSL